MPPQPRPCLHGEVPIHSWPWYGVTARRRSLLHRRMNVRNQFNSLLFSKDFFVILEHNEM